MSRVTRQEYLNEVGQQPEFYQDIAQLISEYGDVECYANTQEGKTCWNQHEGCDNYCWSAEEILNNWFFPIINADFDNGVNLIIQNVNDTIETTRKRNYNINQLHLDTINDFSIVFTDINNRKKIFMYTTISKKKQFEKNTLDILVDYKYIQDLLHKDDIDKLYNLITSMLPNYQDWEPAKLKYYKHSLYRFNKNSFKISAIADSMQINNFYNQLVLFLMNHSQIQFQLVIYYAFQTKFDEDKDDQLLTDKLGIDFKQLDLPDPYFDIDDPDSRDHIELYMNNNFLFGIENLDIILPTGNISYHLSNDWDTSKGDFGEILGEFLLMKASFIL